MIAIIVQRVQHVCMMCIRFDNHCTVIADCSKTHSLYESKKDMEVVVKSVAIAGVYEAVKQCTGMHSGHVTCVIAPASKRGVVCNKAFKAGDLKLTCFTMSMNKHEGPPKAGVDYVKVTRDDESTTLFAVKPPPMPTAATNQDSESKNTGTCSPFWFVERVVPPLANMQRYDIVVKVGDFTVTVPQLRNMKNVSKGDSVKRAKIAD